MTESPRSGVKKGWPTKGSARRNALEQPTNSMRNPAWKHGMDKTDKIWQRETPLWAHHPRKYIMIAGANRNCCRGPTVDGFALRNYCRGPPNSSIDYSACGARHSPPPSPWSSTSVHQLFTSRAINATVVGTKANMPRAP